MSTPEDWLKENTQEVVKQELALAGITRPVIEARSPEKDTAMSEKTTAQDTAPTSTGPSKKRVYTANAAAFVVSVALSAVAAKLIEQATGKVKTAINPDPPKDNQA